MVHKVQGWAQAFEVREEDVQLLGKEIQVEYHLRCFCVDCHYSLVEQAANREIVMSNAADEAWVHQESGCACACARTTWV